MLNATAMIEASVRLELLGLMASLKRPNLDKQWFNRRCEEVASRAERLGFNQYAVPLRRYLQPEK